MQCEINDRRSPEEQRTHRVLIGGQDPFLSGWGAAEHGVSYAIWACKPEDRDAVLSWVRHRSDIAVARIYSDDFDPAADFADAAHISIYVVNSGHPALHFN